MTVLIEKCKCLCYNFSYRFQSQDIAGPDFTLIKTVATKIVTSSSFKSESRELIMNINVLNDFFLHLQEYIAGKGSLSHVWRIEVLSFQENKFHPHCCYTLVEVLVTT